VLSALLARWRWSRSGTFAQIRSVVWVGFWADCWSRSGTFAQIRCSRKRTFTLRCWSRSGTFAQIRCQAGCTRARRAGVGREPSLRYARRKAQRAGCDAGVGREPSLRYAGTQTAPLPLPLESVGNLRSDTLWTSGGRVHRTLESVGNLRSDTLSIAQLQATTGWSRSGTFAQIR